MGIAVLGTDSRLRRLERAALGGDPQALDQLYLELQRVGDGPETFRLVHEVLVPADEASYEPNREWGIGVGLEWTFGLTLHYDEPRLNRRRVAELVARTYHVDRHYGHNGWVTRREDWADTPLDYALNCVDSWRRDKRLVAVKLSAVTLHGNTEEYIEAALDEILNNFGLEVYRHGDLTATILYYECLNNFGPGEYAVFNAPEGFEATR